MQQTFDYATERERERERERDTRVRKGTTSQ